MINVQKCTFKLHAGENRCLEREVWILATQSLVHRLAASASPGSLSEIQTLGPCPMFTESESAFQFDPPVIQTGPEAFCLRPSDISCQSLAKVLALCLFFPGIHIGWSESLLLSTRTTRNISVWSPVPICFFSCTATIFIHLWFA